MTWYWHFLYQPGTGTADSEGIRPETDTGNGWEVKNWVSTGLMRNHGEEVSGSNLGQTQSHPLTESGCFLSNRLQYRLNIARTLNKDQKKKKKEWKGLSSPFLNIQAMPSFHFPCILCFFSHVWILSESYCMYLGRDEEWEKEEAAKKAPNLGWY